MLAVGISAVSNCSIQVRPRKHRFCSASACASRRLPARCMQMRLCKRVRLSGDRISHSLDLYHQQCSIWRVSLAQSSELPPERFVSFQDPQPVGSLQPAETTVWVNCSQLASGQVWLETTMQSQSMQGLPHTKCPALPAVHTPKLQSPQVSARQRAAAGLAALRAVAQGTGSLAVT